MKGITSPKEVDCNKSPSSARFESGSAAQSGEIPCTAGQLSPYNPVDPGTCTTNPAYIGDPLLLSQLRAKHFFSTFTTYMTVSVGTASVAYLQMLCVCPAGSHLH